MKKYRKLAELLDEDLLDYHPDLIKELLHCVWTVELNYPYCDNTAVYLLEGESWLKDVMSSFSYLSDLTREIDETHYYDSDSGKGYRKVVWIVGQDGSGIIALWEVEHEQKSHSRRMPNLWNL